MDFKYNTVRRRNAKKIAINLSILDFKYKSKKLINIIQNSINLSRTSLSKKNGWIDKSGITFVYYKQELVQKQLNIGRDKAMRIFSELEKIGLIIRKKQGLGKPTKIFVMNFAKPIDKSDDEDEVICKINALTKSTKTQQKSDKSAQKDEPTSQRSEKSTSEKSKSTS